MSSVLDFGARGDGRTDDMEAIRKALEEGNGTLRFLSGGYLVTRPIKVEQAETGQMSLERAGGTGKGLMGGAGPAFHICRSEGI